MKLKSLLIFIVLIIFIVLCSMVMGAIVAEKVLMRLINNKVEKTKDEVITIVNSLCDGAIYNTSYPDLPKLNTPYHSKKLMYYTFLLCENVTNTNCLSSPMPLPDDIDENSVQLITNPNLKSKYGYIMYSPSEETTFVIWSGSASTEMWIHDTEIFPSKPSFAKNEKVRVHHGFLKIYEGLRNNFISILSEYMPKTKRLIIAGHSLGGGMAQLSSWDLFYNNNMNINMDQTFIYTYGSPRCGNEAFSEDLEKINIYRVANSEDIVTAIPFSGSPSQYTHTGKTIYFTKNMGNLSKNHTTAYRDFLG